MIWNGVDWSPANISSFVKTAAPIAHLGKAGGTVGFYGHANVALQTGVAVTAGGIHAALVALGLITA